MPPKETNAVLLNKECFQKNSKSHQTFGLLLKDNLSPRTSKIAKSGHTVNFTRGALRVWQLDLD